MNKADLIHKRFIKRILLEGSKDVNPRPRYASDGKPAHSIFITQAFEQYDLSKGELPITTLRPIAIKGGINELLAIYQTQTNTREGFESHSVRWWEDWMNEDGNIGRAYSYNLESHRPNEMEREIVSVERKIIDEEYGELKNSHFKKCETELSIDGNVYECEDGEYIIIEKFRAEDKKGKKRTYKKIQFIKTGYITTCRYDSKGAKDRYRRSVLNVGYLDDESKVKHYPKELVSNLFEIWSNMIKRCYDKDRKDSKYYKDIFVHQDWHSFGNFVRDCHYLPQFHIAKENKFKDYHLDKDYYESNCYSRETCVFLHKNDNQLYRNSRLFYLRKGKILKRFIKLQDAIDFIGEGTTSNLHKSLQTSKKYKGFDVYYTDDDLIYRYELSRNQVNELIKNLNSDKFSRRHMLSFYHWANQDKKQLVECAFMTLWSVRKVRDEYYLDCTLIQRSSDYLVAGFINCIQYVALQMMVAHECGYKVGKFARFTQNLHIYDRHIEQAHELLNRTPSDKQPKLILNAEGKSFYEIEESDFELIDYEPVKPQLKFDLGI